MKTETEITQQIKELESELKEAKHDRRKTFERITGVDADKFRIIDPDFIVVECDNIQDMKNVLTHLKPFKNGWKITDGIYITSLYKITLSNNYHNRELKIAFENMSGQKFWVNIKVNNLPEWFTDTFLVETKRKLYDTETHYVNIPSHYKKFRDIRIQAFSFPSHGQQVSFYGGDNVCKDELLIKEMIEEILNA